MALSTKEIPETERIESAHSLVRTRWTAMLVACTIFGAFAGLGGILLSAASWFVSDPSNRLGIFGTILTALFFPLLFIAAHSLDKIRTTEMELRTEECKKTGLKAGSN